MAGCVCSRVRSALTVSASLYQPTMPDHHSACSHSQQTACTQHVKQNTSASYAQTPAHLGLLILRVVLPVYITGWCLVLEAEGNVSNLSWKIVFQIE